MKMARLLALAVLIFSAVSLVHADSIPPDPVIDVSDPTCGGESGCIPIKGLNFTFQAVGQGGILNFINQSGQAWENLLILLEGVSPESITCNARVEGRAFQFCDKSSEGGVTSLFFHGIGSGREDDDNDFDIENFVPHGIFDNEPFQINLNDLGKNVGSWPAGQSFDASANVPEPATLTLFATGLGLLVARRRLKGRGSSSA